MKIKREPGWDAPYVDVLSQSWSEQKLDELLKEPSVVATIMAGVGLAPQPDGTWDYTHALCWTRMRYPRLESAGLALLLIERFFDTIGAHYLHEEAA